MLQITIELSPEGWDERKCEFVPPEEKVLQLEHSLVSISKWESKWCKPFLAKEEKTLEQTIDYVRCMTLTQNVKPEIYERLSRDNIEQINNYIAAPMTASTVNDKKGRKGSSEIVTSELIYYWMFALNIPMECHKWHLNRLLMLIRVCNAKSQPPGKRSRRETINQYAAINAARRKSLGTRG